jgi:hypothetical protein
LHEYAALHQIEREAEFERIKAFFDVSERTADYRAGMVASQILNANRANASDKVWTPADFFPHLGAKAADTPDGESHEDRVRRFLKEGVIPQDDDSAESVRFLREGFTGMKEAMLANAAL